MPELPEVDPEQHLPRVVVSIHTREGRVFRARNYGKEKTTCLNYQR